MDGADLLLYLLLRCLNRFPLLAQISINVKYYIQFFLTVYTSYSYTFDTSTLDQYNIDAFSTAFLAALTLFSRRLVFPTVSHYRRMVLRNLLHPLVAKGDIQCYGLPIKILKHMVSLYQQD